MTVNHTILLSIDRSGGACEISPTIHTDICHLSIKKEKIHTKSRTVLGAENCQEFEQPISVSENTATGLV